MRKISVLISTFILVFSSCGKTNVPQPTEIPIIPPTIYYQSTPSATQPPPTATLISDTKVPTLTLTPGPVIDASGNVNWHPQLVLIALETGGGDGSTFNYPPDFMLLWDGTLLQQGPNYLSPPFVSHLDKKEMCKILNTADASGFFEEPNFYNFPFDGAGSQYVTVNAWKSNFSGTQIFNYALSGAPYYDGLFCRNCPIPSEGTIIQPGLANVYFLLKDYVPKSRKVADVDKLIVYLIPDDREPTDAWPITTISPSELVEKCNATYCYDAGMILDDVVADEFMKKIKGDQVFMVDPILGSTPFRVRLRPVWPYEPPFIYYDESENPQWDTPPPDFTLTCSSDDGQYPLLPLDKENKYWIYAPDGKWGAEIIDESRQILNVRVVNRSGYEKRYRYDPSFFAQSSLMVFPRFWSQSGEYLFINVLSGDFDVTKTPFVNSIGIQRISVSDGKVDYIFAGIEGQEYSYTMSEDGGRIAYIRQGDQPLKITIKDTYSLNERTAALALPVNKTESYTHAGSMVWTIDKKTIYVAAIYEGDVDSGYLIAIDTSNPVNQKIIYERTVPFKLNQFSLLDWYAGICDLGADIEKNCSPMLNLEDGSIIN